MRPDLPPALRSLLDAGVALVRRSSSGRVGLARAADVLPDELLPRRIDLVPPAPLSAKDVTRTLRSAWREKPEKVVDGLDAASPVAVRPGAQVHRAERDGEPVAVKVLRPGLRAAVRNDLALLDALTVPLRQAFPALDAGALLREVRETVLDELDLEHEASTQRRVRRALRDVDGLVVPAPDLALGHEDVLVTELLDGPTLRDAEPDDPEAVARTLVAAHLRAALDGLVLIDPKPGHVVLLGGGTVGLLGVGVARPVDRERVEDLLAALEALRDDDADTFADAVAALLPEDAARRAFDLAREILGDLVRGPALLDGVALAAAADRALARLGAVAEVAAQATPHPQDLALARSAAQLAATLARLDVTEDWGALALAARDAVG